MIVLVHILHDHELEHAAELVDACAVNIELLDKVVDDFMTEI